MTLSSLYLRRDTPFKLHEINTKDATDQQLIELSSELGLGLNLLEMKQVQAYFKRQKRNPTDLELQTIGQTWSEHCCHKTFKGRILLNGSEIDSLFKTYISRATKEINPRWCIS